MRPGLLPPVLVLALLAGCLGGGQDGSGPGASGADTSRILDPDEAPSDGGTGASPTPEDVGEIRGRVVDDVDLPVANADVSVLGAEAVAATDNNGSFTFPSVPAGTHTLRVESVSYRPHEGTVSVKAGRVTEVTLVVVGFEDRGPGYRPHLHDLWGTDTSVLLLDETLDVRQTTNFLGGRPVLGQAYETVVAPNQNISWPIPIPSERADGRPPIVLPGTRQVTVTVTWNAQEITLPRVGLKYETAAPGPILSLAPRASGQPFVIPVGPGEADHGHQSFSLWAFSIFGGNHATAAGFSPAVVNGAFKVRIEMLKGELPVDPPHEDAWNGSTSLLVRKYEPVTGTLAAAPEACETTPRFYLDNKMVIPPGATQLRMKFHWQPATLPSGHPGEKSWALRWKPADLHPTQTEVAQYSTMPPSGGSGSTLTYTVPLKPAQTDAYYQTKSNWIFAATAANPALGSCGASGTGVAINTSGMSAAYTRFQLEVYADKGAPPS